MSAVAFVRSVFAALLASVRMVCISCIAVPLVLVVLQFLYSMVARFMGWEDKKIGPAPLKRAEAASGSATSALDAAKEAPPAPSAATSGDAAPAKEAVAASSS